MTCKRNRSSFSAILFLIALVTLSSCNSAPAANEDPTTTPTPIKAIPEVPPSITPTPSKCAGLEGELEVQVLVGPADAVGLEPVAVGNIPFAVTTAEAPYLIQGNGRIDYSDILAEEWGTYVVTMNLDLTVTGECDADGNSGELALAIEMSGTQDVEVTADGFHGKYPWSGTQTREIYFHLEEGAVSQGEGYVFILHLN